MAETLRLEIVTPEGLKLAESVEQVTAPGVEGEFGVLPQHSPHLAALTAGIVTYVQGGQPHSVAIGPGFAEIFGDRTILLTERFTTKEAIDAVRVRLELKEVDEALDHFAGDPASPEYAALVQRELWAATQLELHGDPPPPRVRPFGEFALSGAERYRADAGAEGSEGAEPERH